jgi:hypothetical protein
MTEQHGYELAPTTEPAGVALSPVLNDDPLKLGARKQLQHLAENARYSYYGCVGPPYGSRLSTQTVAAFYRRRSKANLDKSDLKHKRDLARKLKKSETEYDEDRPHPALKGMTPAQRLRQLNRPSHAARDVT